MPDPSQNKPKESRFQDILRKVSRDQMTPETTPVPEQPKAEPTREAPPTPEKEQPRPEFNPEKVRQEQGQPSFQQSQPTAQTSPQTQQSPKTPTRKKIESILSEDVSDLYSRMDPATKQAFRAEGIRVAERIEHMVVQAKLKAKDVIELIRNWLQMIPGINKFFLEQAIKIKADKIAHLSTKNKNK